MRILIIGAGNSGLAMSVHLASFGHKINIWNRSISTIEKLIDYRQIKSTGVVQGIFNIDIITNDIKLALESVDVIMVTTPADSHKDIAKLLGQNMTMNIPIVLNPGRTFGAIEFSNIFALYSNQQIRIAETQTILYTCRKTDFDSVNIISLKNDVLIAGFNCDIAIDIFPYFPKEIIKYFKIASNIIETSLGNVGMVLHCAPIILNTGWIENTSTVFKYYYDGITPTISNFIKIIDQERVEVARLLGSTIESTEDWLKRTYKLQGNSLFECIQNNDAYRTIDAPKSLYHRYIFEDVPCGLVPLESMGISLGLEMHATKTIIDLASLLLNTDFRKQGRQINVEDLFKLRR